MAKRSASSPYGATTSTMPPATIDASEDFLIASPRANERAIERSTGPLTAPHASLSVMHPSRTSTQRQPSAIGSRAFGACAATVIVMLIRPRVAQRRAVPRGGGALLMVPDLALAGGAEGGPPGKSLRPNATMYAVPASAFTAPMPEMSKTFIEKLGSWSEAALAATRLVDEPIIERVPPSIVANDSGMSSCDALRPSDADQLWTIGMSIAQTGVLFMNAEMAMVARTRRSTAIS
mmetsp:Transcript_32659/g.85820  ORF Transcript_32659/g.85820 Transcript_32659/m.85820 type:complete len:235 (-) Transcript_32659:570-1274(-)